MIEMAGFQKLEVASSSSPSATRSDSRHTVTTVIVSATGRQGVGLADYEYFIPDRRRSIPATPAARSSYRRKAVGINTAILQERRLHGHRLRHPGQNVKEVAGESSPVGR